MAQQGETDSDRLAKARREAEEARAWLEAVVHQMPSGVVIADAASGQVVLANRHVGRLWQRSTLPVKEWDFKSFPAYYPDGTPMPDEERPLEKALKGYVTMDQEMEVERGDGGRLRVSVNAAPIRDRDGHVVAAAAVLEDITEQSRHEEETAFLVEASRILSSSLDYQETLASVARLAIPRIADWCSVDLLEDGEMKRVAVVHEDPRKQQLADELAARWPIEMNDEMGIPKVLRSGKPALYSQVDPQALRAVMPDDFVDALLELGLSSAMIIPIIARKHKLGTISFFCGDVRCQYSERDVDAAERLAAKAAIAIDNAMLYRQAERSRKDEEEARYRAEDANRSKSEFLANMSHEMRTPLNAVTGYTELLEMEVAGSVNDEQKKQLARIRMSADHLLTLINDLLDLARIEAGRLGVEEERAKVADAVRAAVTMVMPQAEEKQVSLIDDCSAQSGMTYVGDAERVEQILVNLVGNAVKFTESEGSVRVTCAQVNKAPSPAHGRDRRLWTCIQVKDTGIGIEPEQMERIFLPFEQAEGGYTRESGGAGLGLAISRKLALLMGGELTAESTPGEGSTFVLWLPTEARARPGREPDHGETDLAAVGRIVLHDTDRILEKYVDRLRHDPALTRACDVNPSDLRDHHGCLLADFAASLIAIEEGGVGESHFIADSGKIQDIVAELHGRQRARLGWTEDGLRREFELCEEVLNEALTANPLLEDKQEAMRRGKKLLADMLQRARDVSLAGFREGAEGPV